MNTNTPQTEELKRIILAEYQTLSIVFEQRKNNPKHVKPNDFLSVAVQEVNDMLSKSRCTEHEIRKRDLESEEFTKI